MKTPHLSLMAGSRKALVALAGIPGILALQSAELEFSLAPANQNFLLGTSFAAVGDRDFDGIVDFAVADPGANVGGAFFSGTVYLVSGADGQILHEWSGTPTPSQSFGSAIAALDADGDGIADLAVGASGQSFGAGALSIFSGADHAPLLQLLGPSFSYYGSALAPAGDHNGDGCEDLFVGAPRANGGLGSVELLSGADGASLWTVSSTNAASSFGMTLATVGDIDGDGKPDVAVGSPDYRIGGRVSLIRSSNRSEAAQITGVGFYDRLGSSLKSVDDVDGDGYPDLLIGSYSGGACYVASGVDLSILVDLSIPTQPAFQPLVAGGSIDIDADGTSDWLVGSPGFEVDGFETFGGFRVFSGADQSVILAENSDLARSGLGLSLAVLPGFGFAVGEPWLVDPLSGGRGGAHFWSVASDPDSDGDGIPDSQDAVPNSNVGPTIAVQGGESGVENRIGEDGTTLADRFDALPGPEELGNQGRYVASLADLLKELQEEALISKDEAKAIHKATVQALAHRDRD
ncbi:FG-GAP-like repeat-containing protein [Haloferula helveola]